MNNRNAATPSTGFTYSASPSAKILVLGSMPSIVSLEQQQYYANPRNCFWDIIEKLFSLPRNLEYQQRLLLLQSHNIALWDVVHQCVRQGSLDSNIKQVIANDFLSFYREHSAIAKIFFNGQKAAELYKKKIFPKLPVKFQQIQTSTLPSTSPAHAALNQQQKLIQWRAIKPA